MRAEIISIGDELTSGQRLDTNSQWLSERLYEIGVPVAFHTTVGDRLADNVLVFRQAAERADVVVATGGLGPTADDLTRQALAEVAGVPLVQDDASLAHIKALFARRKRQMPPANVVQAQFPQGSRPIPNPNGSAPGIDIDISRGECGPLAPREDMSARGASGPRRSARVFALPGVPAEMKEMWAASVAPAVQTLLGAKRVIAHYRIKCFGVGESDLEAMLPDLIARQRYPLVGITVHQATITLRITAEGETAEAARAAMQPTIDTIHACLGDLIFGYEEEELQDVVVRLLHERGKTLSVVEFGTGGLLCSMVNDSLYAAGVFRTGEVNETAEFFMLVAGQKSVEGVEFMMRMIAGGRWHTKGTDYVLMTGPFPSIQQSSPELPPYYYAVAFDGGEIIRSAPYAGHPEILKPRAAKQALNLLRLHLLGKL